MEEKSKIKNFRDLDVWRLGMEIVFDVYECTKKFPKEEMYGLVGQSRRAAVSIASNIAEGFNRYHNKEYKQFLYIALGSCAELETQNQPLCSKLPKYARKVVISQQAAENQHASRLSGIEVSGILGYINQAPKDKIIEKLDHESRMIRNLIKRLET